MGWRNDTRINSENDRRVDTVAKGSLHMKVLVIGAGVLGSVYAARLAQAGQVVTIFARGRRLNEIREYGLVLINEQTQRQTVTRVETVDALNPDDQYDLVLVLVRKNQLASVLPCLANSRGTPQVLFMVNNAAGPGEIIQQLGRERVILGFPGAGGERDGHVVRYRIVNGLLQPTTVGELDGLRTARIEEIASILAKAGFPTAISTHIDAWLKTHAVFVSPIANAIYLAGGSNYSLARHPNGLARMIAAMREGFRVLHALGIPVTPAKFRAIEWLPKPLLIAMCRVVFNTRQAELVLARHANSARDEMGQIAREVQQLAAEAGVATPHSNDLANYIGVESLPAL